MQRNIFFPSTQNILCLNRKGDRKKKKSPEIPSFSLHGNDDKPLKIVYFELSCCSRKDLKSRKVEEDLLCGPLE